MMMKMKYHSFLCTQHHNDNGKCYNVFFSSPFQIIIFNVSGDGGGSSKGEEGRGRGIGKEVGSQGLVLHSFFPFFCLFTQIYMYFFKNSYTSIVLHDMKWPYTIMHSHIHNRCYIDLNINYTLTWRVNKIS
jgi:hypothetical protein